MAKSTVDENILEVMRFKDLNTKLRNIYIEFIMENNIIYGTYDDLQKKGILKIAISRDEYPMFQKCAIHSEKLYQDIKDIKKTKVGCTTCDNYTSIYSYKDKDKIDYDMNCTLDRIYDDSIKIFLKKFYGEKYLGYINILLREVQGNTLTFHKLSEKDIIDLYNKKLISGTCDGLYYEINKGLFQNIKENSNIFIARLYNENIMIIKEEIYAGKDPSDVLFDNYTMVRLLA